MLSLIIGASLALIHSAPPVEFVKVIAEIRSADYAGDRAKLDVLYSKSKSLVGGKEPQQWVRYWRGFAMWRKAVNGFNDGAGREELESALRAANEEFELSIALDPRCFDSKLGEAACLMSLAYLFRQDATAVAEFISPCIKLLYECEKSDALNPRLYWVKGPGLWNVPAERGGGQDAAFASYNKGLELWKTRRKAKPYEPDWGEPELLMSLAWSTLNQQKPDPDKAESYAHAALKRVPQWHYVRDILLPQILKAKQSKTD